MFLYIYIELYKIVVYNIKSLTWYNEHISILVPVVCSMSRCTIANGETRCLIADQLKNQLKIIEITFLLYKQKPKSYNKFHKKLLIYIYIYIYIMLM